MSKKSVSFIREVNNLIKNNIKQVEYKNICFQIKNYLPIVDKLTILELTIQNCIQENDNGIKFYNSAMRHCMLDYLLAKYYTNLAITDDWEKMYNILCESGLMKKIISEIPEEELDWVQYNLDKRINQEKILLDREQQFGNVLKSLIDKLNSNLPEVVESLKNFDPQKLEFLNKINETLNNKDKLQ